MSNYTVLKVGDDYIVAETQEQAVAHHIEVIGSDWYGEGEQPDIQEVSSDRTGHFETEDGSYRDMTFGEFLSDFEYTKPQVICWNE